MLSKPFKLTLLGLFVVLGVGAIVIVRKDNDRLRRRLSEQRQQDALSARLQAENQGTKELIARFQVGESEGARAMQADLVRAREELTRLEKGAAVAAEQNQARLVRETQELANSLDPERGLTRLEHFRNVGQQTPAAAFQTLVWAGLKGDEAALRQLVELTPEARAHAEALVARLPEAERAPWTPDKIGALFVTALLVDLPALRIMEAKFDEAGQRAKLTFQIPEHTKQTSPAVPMRLGPQGWRVLIEERQIEKVRQRIDHTDPPAAR
ncbi:MAG TPA: hypothetical protein VHO24_11940 [Opitutaceae bacterium]|nr:hypothetical protein [Opitutaceae bacterium]